jgi:hypothetical protein
VEFHAASSIVLVLDPDNFIRGFSFAAGVSVAVHFPSQFYFVRDNFKNIVFHKRATDRSEINSLQASFGLFYKLVSLSYTRFLVALQRFIYRKIPPPPGGEINLCHLGKKLFKRGKT